MTADPKRSANVVDADGKGLCSSVESAMVLVVQTLSYIKYELLIERPWQWDCVMSMMRHDGTPGSLGILTTAPKQGDLPWTIRAGLLDPISHAASKEPPRQVIGYRKRMTTMLSTCRRRQVLDLHLLCLRVS